MTGPTALMVFNVQTYGAVGNGTTDDTAAINAAVSAMTTASAHGGILYFPPSTGGYFIKPIANFGINVTPSIAVPQGYMVAGIAGFGFFTQSRLVASSTTGMNLVTNGAGILSNTQGYIFDGVPGRSIGFATLPPSTANFATNAVRGAAPGQWLLFSSTSLWDTSPNTNLFAIQNWSDDDLQTAQPSDLVAPMTAATATIDPHAVVLENGHIVCAFTASGTSCPGGSGSAIQTWISTDGGRTWSQQATICPTPATQAFTEPYMIRLRQRITGVANRIVMIFCDADPTHTRDTVYRIAWSDNEGVTWNQPASPATPTSGSMSAGLIDDGSQACVFEDGASNIQVFYSRMVTSAAPALLQTTLSGGTYLPTGTPSVITTCPVQQRSDSVWFGLGPKVIRLRTGECGLYFTGTNFSRGEFHFMTSPFANPGTWVNERLVGAVPSGATGGFGGIKPVRKYTDGMDLILQLNGQPFSIMHYGA